LSKIEALPGSALKIGEKIKREKKEEKCILDPKIAYLTKS